MNEQDFAERGWSTDNEGSRDEALKTDDDAMMKDDDMEDEQCGSGDETETDSKAHVSTRLFITNDTRKIKTREHPMVEKMS